MKTIAACIGACLAAAALAAPLAASAQDARDAQPTQERTTGPSPLRMDPDKMAGLELTPIPNTGFVDILVEGELEFQIARLFSGEELQVVVVESTPAKTDHRNRPLEYDEFVLVLDGKLVLTEQDGTRHEFTPGDAFVVPKGYTGTWEQHGSYRELAVIARRPD